MITSLLLAIVVQQADTTLLGTAATLARAAATPPARVVPLAATQCRNGRALLDSARWDDALAPLQVGVRLGQTDIACRGDLAYTLAKLERWDDAATAYQMASQLQSTNPWYYVGLAIVRAGQTRYGEAGGMLSLAASTDSAVISERFVDTILDYYDRAGQQSRTLEWYRIGTQRFPMVSIYWLRLAQLSRARADTATGLAAVRRYVTLRPGEPLGIATYATYLYDLGQNDSAITLAEMVAADSSYREYASTLYFGVGTRAFAARDYARAAQVLRRGQALASNDLLPRFGYYLGFADLQRAVGIVQAANQARDCAAAQVADSLAGVAEQNLRVGVTLDSANVNNALTTTVPRLREAARGMQTNFCPPTRRRD